MKKLEHELDRLFAAPLGEFTAMRNALSASLQQAGDVDGAGWVKALRKPAVSAWVINQLWFQHRERMDELRRAGDGLRDAQAATLSGNGANLIAAQRKRTEAIQELLRLGRALLAEGGHGTSAQTLQRTEATLEAWSTGMDARLGRLTEDLASDGVDTLAALAASMPAPKRRRPARKVVPTGPDSAKINQARAKLTHAERREATLIEAFATNAEELTRATERVAEARMNLLEAEKAARELTARQKELEKGIASARREAGQAKRSLKRLGVD